MPWQDGIEVTDEMMKAVVGWEGKLTNFFLKSLEICNHSSPSTSAKPELGIADQQLSSALDQAKVDVDAALCDSFNTPAVMRIISDLISAFNSADATSDQTSLLLARWVTRIVTVFGLDYKGDLNDPDRIGWSGLEIPAPAKPYIYPASLLRDQVRTLARSGQVDHTALWQLADTTMKSVAITTTTEPSEPYNRVLRHFCLDFKALAAQRAPAKDLLDLCDQLRDVHLWNLGLYLEDRNLQSALVRPLDKLLKETSAERESAGKAKAKAKLEQEAREAEREKELREHAQVDPLLMFKTSDEYLEWGEFGIPTIDAAGNAVPKNKRKKLVKEWEKHKKRHEEWSATHQGA